MDDSGFMCRSQGVGDLRRDARRFVERQRPLRNAIAKRWPFDELENQRLRVSGLFEPIDRTDVGMIELCQRPGFPLESSDPIGIGGKQFGQHFDRDVAIKLPIARTIHHAHAAFAEGGQDFVRPETTAWSEGHRRSAV
jgi:hypothetical protein